MNDVRRYQLVALLAALLVVVVVFVRPQESKAPTNTTNQANTNVSANTNTTVETIPSMDFFTDDVPDANIGFRFTAKIPSGWVADLSAAGTVMTLYRPTLTTESLQVTSYTGSFADPTGADGLPDRSAINGHEARTFVITTGTSTQTIVDIAVTSSRVARFTFAADLKPAIITLIRPTITVSSL